MSDIRQSELWIGGEWDGSRCQPTIQDEPCPPFGGQGLSGSGREGTEADLDILTEWKWITLRMGKRG
jgi:hypothetical protein